MICVALGSPFWPQIAVEAAVTYLLTVSMVFVKYCTGRVKSVYIGCEEIDVFVVWIWRGVEALRDADKLKL